MQRINEHICRLTLPYKDIFTTVYTVETDDGALLFDTGSFDSDAEEYTLPFLTEAGISKDRVKYIFISHNHKDHAGGLACLLPHLPNAKILSRSPKIKEQYPTRAEFFDDGATVSHALQLVTLPGHTEDSAALYDTRTKTLISGDGLQLYGIFGSGNWGANISFPRMHMTAIKKLRGMDIAQLLTAHDYHPYGHRCRGKEAVLAALDAAEAPLLHIKELIQTHPDLNDDAIAALYNQRKLPTLGAHVVTAVRKAL